MAQNAVSFPDLALDKFSGNDPDQDVKSFLLTVENKIDFSLGSPPNDAGEAARYLFRKKALFSSLLRGPAAEWYEGFNVGNPLPTWIQVRTAFITRFSDDRDKYRHRITAENCVRGKEELVKNFYHRVKQAVDKGWPIDAAANQNERDAQQNLRNQKYIDFTIRGLTPSGLKRKAHEYLIEHPNTTWDNFKDHVANKDLIYSVSSEFVPNSTNEQNSKLDSLEKQVRELSTLLKEQQVNALNQANTRTNDVNKKSRQNATRFCHYCRRNGHTLQYCRIKAFDDERKRQYNRENQQKKPTFTNDYNKRKGPNFGSQNYHNSNSQYNSNPSQKYGNGYSPPYNRNQNFSNQNHNNQSNSNQGQNQRTGQNNYNFPARQNNNSNTQYNRNFPQNNSNALSNNVQFIDDDSQEMINSISNYFALNY